MYAASRRAAGFVRAATAGVFLSLLTVAGAHALTVDEAEVGEFSSDWANPSEIGDGVDRVDGTGSQNAYDIFHFSGLSMGAQELTMTFIAPETVDDSYSAGGGIRWSEEPFRWGWDGNETEDVALDVNVHEQSVTLNLAESFAGDLYLGLYFTHGASLSYSILADAGVTTQSGGIGSQDPGQGDRPSSPAVGGADAPSASAVPLPPALVMLGAGLAALGFVARRRAA